MVDAMKVVIDGVAHELDVWYGHEKKSFPCWYAHGERDGKPLTVWGSSMSDAVHNWYCFAKFGGPGMDGFVVKP